MSLAAPALLADPAPALSGLDAVLQALTVPVVRLRAEVPSDLQSDAVLVVVATGDDDVPLVDELLARVVGGGRGVLAVSVGGAIALRRHPVVGGVMSESAHVLASPDPADPLVLDPHVVGAGCE